MTNAFDQERAEAAVRELLIAVGEDPDREGLKDTPARVARAYQEVFAGRTQPTDGPADLRRTTRAGLVRAIPSTRRASITSCPSTARPTSVTSREERARHGLSKLARLADMYAAAGAVDAQIADALSISWARRRSSWSLVRHLCGDVGIRKPGSTTTTAVCAGSTSAASRAGSSA